MRYDDAGKIRLDTVLPHLATKAELKNLESKLTEKIGQTERTMTGWFAGTAIAIITAIIASSAALISILKVISPKKPDIEIRLYGSFSR